MTKSKKNQDLKQAVPDPVARLEVLIDGDDDLGVRGLRGRMDRVERWLLIGILTGFGNLIGWIIGDRSALIASIVEAVLKFSTGG